MKLRLAQIAHARSGDKANRADIGLFAWNAAGYALIERHVTPERVAAHFKHNPVVLISGTSRWRCKIYPP